MQIAISVMLKSMEKEKNITLLAVSWMMAQSRSMSATLVYCDVTVNRMTYFPLNEAGTMCTFPDEFKRRRSISVLSLSPWNYISILIPLWNHKFLGHLGTVLSVSVFAKVEAFQFTLRRKTTIPRCLVVGSSNLSSAATINSNFFASRIPCKYTTTTLFSRLFAVVRLWLILKRKRQETASYLPDVFLNSFHSKRSENKPQLQRSESSTQGNLPVLKLFHLNDDCVLQFSSKDILDLLRKCWLCTVLNEDGYGSETHNYFAAFEKGAR